MKKILQILFLALMQIAMSMASYYGFRYEKIFTFNEIKFNFAFINVPHTFNAAGYFIALLIAGLIFILIIFKDKLKGLDLYSWSIIWVIIHGSPGIIVNYGEGLLTGAIRNTFGIAIINGNLGDFNYRWHAAAFSVGDVYLFLFLFFVLYECILNPKRFEMKIRKFREIF